MELISSLREAAGNPSYRKMAEETGIKFNRIMDLLKQRNGTPTLQEFISLCLLFDQDPADALRRIVTSLGGTQAALAACQPTEAPSPVAPTVEPPETKPAPMPAADAGSRVEATLRQLQTDPFSLAANHSPYKYDTDPDTDHIA